MNDQVTLEDLVIFEQYITDVADTLAKQLASCNYDRDISLEAQQAYINWLDLIERMKENHFSARHYQKAQNLLSRLHGVLLLHKVTNSLLEKS